MLIRSTKFAFGRNENMDICQNTVWILDGKTELKVENIVEVELNTDEKIVGEVNDIVGEVLIVCSKALGEVEIDMREVSYIHIK